MDNLVKVSLQLEPSIAAALDTWQKQRFIRSRSSAVNQLLATGLGLAAPSPSPQVTAPQPQAVPALEVMPISSPPSGDLRSWGIS